MPTLKALNTRPPDLTSSPRGYDRYKLVYDHIRIRSWDYYELCDKLDDLIKREQQWLKRKRRRRRDAKSRHQTLLFAGIPPRHGQISCSSDDYPDLAAFLKSRIWATWCGWYCFNPQSTTYVWRTVRVYRMNEEEYERYKNGEKIPKNKKEYRRRRNSNRKRQPNQSAEFSPSQHMPPRWIGALHAAHDAQARMLFSCFDDEDPDLQLRVLVFISFGRFDRELGLS